MLKRSLSLTTLICALTLSTKAQTYVQLSPSAQQTGGFNVSGTGITNLLMTSQTSSLNSQSELTMALNTVARWGIGVFNTENGTNMVGSDFSIFGYDNTGTYLGQDMVIQRSTGYMALGSANTSLPSALLHLRMPANSANSTLNFGYGTDPGNSAVPLGAITGGYNIDFTTFSNTYPNQAGARIRAERLNNYAANSALIQSMDLAFYTSDGALPSDLGERMRIKSNGNVGIGTSSPTNKLQIDPGGPGGIFLGNANGSSGGYTNLAIALSAYTNGYANIQCTGAAGSSYGNIVLNAVGGSVAIGTTNPQGYLFAVNGSAIFTKVVVKANANWPDFVFDSAYKPESLDNLSRFVRLYKHLPGIPSALEIGKDGQDLGSMQRLQLQKIEELTVYQIEANNKINQLQNENEALKKELDDIKMAVEKIKIAQR